MDPKERRNRDPKKTTDDKLDSALKDTFPASDPVSFIEPARTRLARRITSVETH